MEYTRQLAVWVQSVYVSMSLWGSSFIRRESIPGMVPFLFQFGMSPVVAVICSTLVSFPGSPATETQICGENLVSFLT